MHGIDSRHVKDYHDTMTENRGGKNISLISLKNYIDKINLFLSNLKIKNQNTCFVIAIYNIYNKVIFRKELPVKKVYGQEPYLESRNISK